MSRKMHFRTVCLCHEILGSKSDQHINLDQTICCFSSLHVFLDFSIHHLTHSEYKALRLTGGLDRCSGRVEFHRNGRWGTVCDTCWQKQEAAMACDMLKCGGLRQFTAFDPPFMHKNETHWYFYCATNNNNLWQCQEVANNPYLCKESKAAGLICNSK